MTSNSTDTATALTPEISFSYSPPTNFLSGKTLLITGAGDGIGKCCAMTYAQYGARVILLGRTVEKLEQVYDQIEAAFPGMAFIHPLDLADVSADSLQPLYDSIDENFGRLDGLIHNAALLGPRSPIEFYPEKSWQDLMQVNVTAAFLMTQKLLPLLAKAESARLIFTSSSVGRIGRAYWGAYSVSKFAVEGLMQTLADEIQKTSEITVCSLNPGGTRTPMRKSAYPAEDPNTRPTPEQLMPVYLYLFSEAARNLHGQALDAQSFTA